MRSLKEGSTLQDWEVQATVEIGTLYSRYVTLVDGNRSTELGNLFTDAGVLISEVMDRECRGRHAIAAYIDQLRSSWSDIRIHITPPDISLVNRISANGECYFSVLNPAGLDHWGKYSDTFEYLDGSWLYARRRISLDGSLSNSRAGSSLD